MRILYVEDNPANLFLVKRVAKIGGHEVINYIDGEDALTNFIRDKPDLVLMDIQLAGELSGLEVVRRLRATGDKTPIIAVTAYAMIGDRERFLAAGCDDYLAKPLPIPRLVEMIEQVGKAAPKPETPSTAEDGELHLDDAPTRRVPRPNVPAAFLNEILDRAEIEPRKTDETPTVIARQVAVEESESLDDSPTLPTRLMSEKQDVHQDVKKVTTEIELKLDEMEMVDEQDTQLMPRPIKPPLIDQGS